MPLIDVTIPSGSISEDAQAALLEELATRLLHWEGAPDTEFFREITWVYAHEAPNPAVGGRPGGAPRYRVDITVPEGALSARRKQGLVADVHAAVAKAADVAEADALHVWTLIREVPDGNWAGGGHIVEFAALREAAAAERAKAQPVAS
jgi:phenylpyruvate tautomerase PptA (4-oxalocrotonate tautomerase family)